MDDRYDIANRSGDRVAVLVVGTFEDEDAAQDAAASINASLEEAAEAVAALFDAQGGVADGADIDRIYSRFGMRNDVGWQQVRPIFVESEELFWELPTGADAADAEQLLVSLGAEDVVTTRRNEEAWQSAPHPLAIPFVDHDSGEVYYDVIDVEETPVRERFASRKRTLH